MDRKTGVLYGLFDKPWEYHLGATNTARCSFVTSHTAASTRHCSCGFYAYFTSDLNQLDLCHPVTILGVIEGFGKISIGNKGFRCQKAKILALCAIQTHTLSNVFRDGWFARTWLGVTKSVTNHYLKPNRSNGVALFQDWTQLVAEFPPTDPAEIEGLNS